MSRRRLLGAVAGLLVITGVLGWLVFFSGALGLNKIEVRGAQTLSTETIEGVLAIPEGTPLARVDLSAAEATLESISQIESASVSRDWPGTLVVELNERTAIAAVNVNGAIWLVDRFGVLFAQVSALPAGVVVLQADQPGPGDRATLAGVEVIQALSAELRAVLVQVNAPSLTQIELTLTDGRTVIWGSPADSVRKSQILAGLLAGGVIGTVYDVSSPTSAVVR